MGSDEHVQKIPCPKTMPAFDGENPVQALYLKKRGVEKLLNKASLLDSFVEETKTNIAKESMLILRTIDGEFDPTKLETIPSFDENDETSEHDSATTNTEASTIEFNDEYSKCQDVSRYDSDESRSNSDDESDWSLPGIEPDTGIRYVELENSMVFVDDGQFYDDDRMEKKIVQDPRKSNSLNFPQFALCHSTELCHSEELMTTYNEMIAAVADAKTKVEEAAAKAAAEAEAKKKADEEAAAEAEAKKKAEEEAPAKATAKAEAKIKAEVEALSKAAAEAETKKAEEEEAATAEAEAKKKAEEEAVAKAAAEAEAKKKAEEEAAIAEAEATKKSEEEAAAKAAAEAKKMADEEAAAAAKVEAEKKAEEASAEDEVKKSVEQKVTTVGYEEVGILEMYMDMVRCA